MCTVTYFPTEKGFILTQNRDESPKRKSSGISASEELLFPEDIDSSGTWIGADSMGRVISLMNGAFEPHAMPVTKGKSRGLLIPMLLKQRDVVDFLWSMELLAFEPFTLVIAINGELQCMRWDGKLKAFETLNHAVPHLWSSSMLYSSIHQERRRLWYMSWLNGREAVDSSDLRWFHNHGGEGDPAYDLVMDRGDVCTTSITQVTTGKKNVVMRFTDLSTCLVEEKKIPLAKEFDVI